MYYLSVLMGSKKDNNLEDFSARLRKLRSDKGLSQRKLAELLGFSSGTQVVKYESGVSSPSIDVLGKLSDILSVDIHFLVTGSQSDAILHRNKAIRRLSDLCALYIHKYKHELSKKPVMKAYFEMVLRRGKGEQLTKEEEKVWEELRNEFLAIEHQLKEADRDTLETYDLLMTGGKNLPPDE